MATVTLPERAHERVLSGLLSLIESKKAVIGVIGLGYVGLPLVVEFAKHGFSTLGIDVDEHRTAALNAGRSYVLDVRAEDVAAVRRSDTFAATTDYARLRECDAIVICVPTPLNTTSDPDVSYIVSAALAVRTYLRRGQLVVLESTTYPGSTDEILLGMFRETGLSLDEDFLVAFSPERVDPGNKDFATATIPKVVGGCSDDSAEAACALYAQVAPRVHRVSSARAAETTKLLENIFRAVNIGLVNELSELCYELKIDIWEVIEAAKTKPFGFMPFYPGPGLGGHCIPLDPLYLSWKGRQYGFESRFINLAQQVNASMPHRVVMLIGDALNESGRALKDANVLVIGAAYKKDVSDSRESPAADVIRLLREKHVAVQYHDPYVAELRFDAAHMKRSRATMFEGAERRHHPLALAGLQEHRRLWDPLKSIPLTVENLRAADCVVVVTDHSNIDYASMTEHARVIVDTRNAIGADLRAKSHARIVRL